MDRIFHPHLIARFRNACRVAQPWMATTRAWTKRVVKHEDFKYHAYVWGGLGSWAFMSYKLFHLERQMSEHSAMHDAFFCVTLTIPGALLWPVFVPILAAAKLLAITDTAVRCDKCGHNTPPLEACKRCALKTGY